MREDALKQTPELVFLSSSQVRRVQRETSAIRERKDGKALRVTWDFPVTPDARGRRDQRERSAPKAPRESSVAGTWENRAAGAPWVRRDLAGGSGSAFRARRESPGSRESSASREEEAERVRRQTASFAPFRQLLNVRVGFGVSRGAKSGGRGSTCLSGKALIFLSRGSPMIDIQGL